MHFPFYVVLDTNVRKRVVVRIEIVDMPQNSGPNDTR
jgi:hypothetical protein